MFELQTKNFGKPDQNEALVHELQQKLANSQDTVKQLQQEMTVLQLKSFDKENVGKELAHEKLACSSAKATIVQLQSQPQTASKEGIPSEREVYLEKKLRDAMITVTELNNETMALQLSLLEKSDTTEELAVAREQASVAKATIAALHREKFELQNHVRNEQEKKQQGLEQGSQLKQELSLAQAESRSAQGMAIAPQSQAPGGEEQVDTLKRELAQAQGQASSTKATVAALHKELFDLQSLVRNSKLKEKEEGEHTLSAQNERLKAELRALRVELSKLQIQAITAQSPTSTELQEEVTCLKEKNTRLVQKCGSLQGELFAAQGMEVPRDGHWQRAPEPCPSTAFPPLPQGPHTTYGIDRSRMEQVWRCGWRCGWCTTL